MLQTPATSSLQAFIADAAFPCVGAKSVAAQNGLQILDAGHLGDGAHDERIVAALQALPLAHISAHSFVTLAVLFPQTPKLSEEQFERRLWQRLQALHDIDASDYAWDDAVSSDTAAPNFGMSFGGHGFYVVGLHPGASRPARRFAHAALVFNPHLQFKRLREAGAFDRLRDVVRGRDRDYAGSVNPMLADHGVRSEARQYSGRAVGDDWRCPFSAKAKADAPN